MSDADIKKVFKPKNINIVEYQKLPKYKHIDELLINEPYCVLFFPENDESTEGHWTCIIKHANNQYEYFDSYKNYTPDKEQKWLTKEVKKHLHITSPFLTDLFNRSNIKTVICNPYPFQSQKDGICTCGKHVCSRLIFYQLPLTKYWDIIKHSKINPDRFVSILIYKILGKKYLYIII